MEETLKKISDIITEYESGAFKTLDRLRVIRRELTFCHYAITTEKVKYHNLFNIEVNNHQGSNAAAKSFAEYKVPELYLCTNILTSVKLVLDSMQQEISIMKNDN
jgi:hypothetical protein